MNAYVIVTGRRLYPFDDAPDQWRVLDRPLPELQAEALGCRVLPDGERAGFPHLVFHDSLFFTGEAIAAFLQAARRTGKSVQLHAAPGAFADAVLWHLPRDEAGRVPLPLWYHADASAPEPLVLTLDEEVMSLPMPAHMVTPPATGLDTLLTRLPVVEIETWINLYQANVQGLMAHTKRAKHLPWWKGGWALLRGGGTLWGAMAKLNVIGKGCDIHPTAVVELSVLGDGVRVGAHAVVRNCVVGKGAVIDDHASVRASVIGEGASIANNNNVLLSVVYPRTFLISGPYQFAMFGRECAIMHCICCDTRLDGRTVVAEVGPGRSVDSRQRYLGSCYGHGVRAGAGTITAPGRAIPNEIFFLPHPSMVVVNVDPALPRRKNLFTEGSGLTFKGRPPEATLSIPPAEPAEQPR